MRTAAVGVAALGSVIALSSSAFGQASPGHQAANPSWGNTATPIKHLVVIFQENVSFDHYFGTYPNAANADGSTFTAAPGTPAVDGLSPSLLTSNPNAAQPQRLDSTPTGAAGSAGGQITCDQDHNYSDEQQAFDDGKMDQFVQSVGTAGGTTDFGTPCDPKTVMD